jgi:hypothetical protein
MNLEEVIKDWKADNVIDSAKLDKEFVRTSIYTSKRNSQVPRANTIR